MTKKELNAHIEKRYSECCKRSQGLSYGSFYDGYMDCYCEQQKQNADLKEEIDEIVFARGELEQKNERLEKENESLENVKNIYIGDLLKAKEIIKDYMRFEPMIGTCSFYSEEYEKTKIKAEAFIKEIKEK